MRRTLGVVGALLLVLAIFATSVTGAPAPAQVQKSVLAVNDTFNFNIYNNVGNVLDNDRGQGLKVCAISTPINGGTVLMQSDGDFAYLPKCTTAITDTLGAQGTVVHDCFYYKITDKNGVSSQAKVTINFKLSKLTICQLIPISAGTLLA